MNRIYKFFVMIVVSGLLLTSCSDELDTVPSSTVSQSQITDLAEQDPEAFVEILEPQIAGMYGFLVAYNSMDRTSVRHDDHGLKSIFHIADMMGEDIVQTSGAYGWYYHDYIFNQQRVSDGLHPLFVWGYLYRNIKLANDIIIQIPEDTDNPGLRAFRGQALATRAYSYHYLVQFFQRGYLGYEDTPAVPLILEVPNEEGNPRATVREIYAQMVIDLTDAVKYLEGYSAPSKGFINQRVANGFLARVYLTMEEWQLAADAANAARQGYNLMTGPQYLEGFKNVNNPEWMFASIVTSDLAIVQSGIVNHFSFISSFSYGYASLTGMHKAIDRRLYDHMGDSDYRKSAYQNPEGTTFPDGGYNEIDLPAYVNGKFGPSDDGADNTQDLVYMRVSEMYLIEAEALAALGQPGAGTLLQNLMDNRDPEYVLPSTGLLEEIRKQRRIELWGEIGIALFDIKRLGLGINRDYPGSNHPDDAKLTRPAGDWDFTYQIPNDEIDNNVDISSSDNNP